MSQGDNRSDRKLLLYLSAAIIVIIVFVSIMVPGNEKNDTTPSTYNSAPDGVKAAYLTLQATGLSVSRWDKPSSALNTVDATHTTLVILNPQIEPNQFREFRTHLDSFLQRGGHVLLAGAPASLLPGGESSSGGPLGHYTCATIPEGDGPLARAGTLDMTVFERWSAKGPQFRIEQRCGHDGVVVRFPVGKGEAIWWSAATPLSNHGWKSDGDLKLTLASLGSGREILFDEYVLKFHESRNPLDGLPTGWLILQAILLFVLLIWSFGRRKGPLLAPLTLPRTSPIEFAESMGDLYAKASATTVATAAAQRRLLRLLQREAGVSHGTVEQGPQAIGDALTVRLGGDWSLLVSHLESAAQASDVKLSTRSALTLIKAMADDENNVRTALQPSAATKQLATNS